MKPKRHSWPWRRLVGFVSMLTALLACGKADREAEIQARLETLPPGVYAHFETNQGDFLARLFTHRAPKITANFIELAEGTKPFTDLKSGKQVKRPYYDGLLFHQVINHEFILGGDPTGVGHGSPGYELEEEFSPELAHDKAGILSMNKQSQVMIMLNPSTRFDELQYVFGEVVWGMESVNNIAEIPTHFRNRPIRDAVIRHVRIHRTELPVGPPGPAASEAGESAQ